MATLLVAFDMTRSKASTAAAGMSFFSIKKDTKNIAKHLSLKGEHMSIKPIFYDIAYDAVGYHTLDDAKNGDDAVENSSARGSTFGLTNMVKRWWG